MYNNAIQNTLMSKCLADQRIKTLLDDFSDDKMVRKQSTRRSYQRTLSALHIGAVVVGAQEVNYGVDVSMPMHHATVSTNYATYPWNAGSEPVPEEFEHSVVQPLGNRQSFYEETIQGCIDYYGKDGISCLQTEHDRVAMNLRQPQSVLNYTDIGFKKIRTPDEVWKLVNDFWDRNKQSQPLESHQTGESYINYWTSPTRMVDIENTKLRGGGSKVKQAIWKAAKSTIADWTHASLREVSLYGIRVYTRGSVLAPHVDRLPLVSSAIICVDANVDEPWPLEVIGHDGRAHNVTMEPGDMVLYESHSIIHGRPFPLKGEYVANLFVHFEPENLPEQFNPEMNRGMKQRGGSLMETERNADGHGHDSELVESDNDSVLPLYVIPGSPEALRILSIHHPATEGATLAHSYAASGDLDSLVTVISDEEDLVHAADENGWTPLHEGVRAGSIEIVQYLLSQGAYINHRTGGDESGFSPLAIAHMEFGPDHAISKFIESVGGMLIEPEL